ncbi:MAG TPA: hypothetical protein VFN30_02275 [Chitinophagaceae bacterium]|nr:hypothetical protein [Chitinophagaceae bacterium]
MREYLSFALFIIFFNAEAQKIRQPVAAGYIGLGAYSKNFSDGYSFTQNQAALANVKSASATVYTEKRFLIQELSLYSASIVLPTTSGNFGVQADYFGFKNFNETQFGLAYGRDLGSKVDVGVKFNYYGVHIPTYGSASTFTAEAGILLHLTEKIHAGIHIFNPAGGKLGKNQEEKIASVYKFGLGYEVSDIFFISSEISKQEDQPVNVTVGFQYNLIKQFLIRGGIVSATNSSFAGVGVGVKQLRIDVVASYHPQLGFTPGLLVLFEFGKRKESLPGE